MTAQEQAEKLVAEWYEGVEAEMPATDLHSLADAITTALLSARNEAIEECARVADGYNGWVYVKGAGAGNWEPGSPYDCGQEQAAKNIASALRALKG